jgi:hypothetical protein
MGFGFTAEAQRSLRGAKEDGKRVFTAKGGKGAKVLGAGTTGIWIYREGAKVGEGREGRVREGLKSADF